MKRIALLILTLTITSSYLIAQNETFSREDRERLVRVEEGQQSLQRQIDDLKDSTQRQFDEIRRFMLWGFGILFGGMGILIGFVIWDRRNALQPVVRRQAEMDSDLFEIARRSQKMEQALREYAKKESKMDDVIKSVGL